MDVEEPAAGIFGPPAGESYDDEAPDAVDVGN